MLNLVREDINDNTVKALENQLDKLENSYNNWSMEEETFKDWMINLKNVHDKYKCTNTEIRDLVDIEASNDLEQDILELNVYEFLNLQLNELAEVENNEMPFEISLS